MSSHTQTQQRTRRTGVDDAPHTTQPEMQKHGTGGFTVQLSDEEIAAAIDALAVDVEDQARGLMTLYDPVAVDRLRLKLHRAEAHDGVLTVTYLDRRRLRKLLSSYSTGGCVRAGVRSFLDKL